MKVLVTGGTGFVGREVVRQLTAAAHEVWLWTRAGTLVAVGQPSRLPPPQSPSRLVAAGKISETPAGGTPAGTAAGRDACPTTETNLTGFDAIIHLAGIINEVGDQTFENVHTRLTEKIVTLAKRTGVKRFLHISALGTRANATARYHQTKWAAEEIVRASGLDWTIFRPSIIYGPGDGFVNLFARLARFSPVVPLIGGGRTKFQPVSVENVARCFVAALNEPAACGKVFNLAGEDVLTMREMVETVLRVTRRRRLLLPLPFAIARTQAALAEFCFAKLLRRPPPLNRDQVTMLREDNVSDTHQADELFGLRHEPFAEAIARYLQQARQATDPPAGYH